MDDTTVMIKVDFQDMQIIGMMHSVIVKNRAECGVQEIRCQRLIVDIGQKFVYTKLIVLKEVLRESGFGKLIGGKCGLVRAVNVCKLRDRSSDPDIDIGVILTDIVELLRYIVYRFTGKQYDQMLPFFIYDSFRHEITDLLFQLFQVRITGITVISVAADHEDSIVHVAEESIAFQRIQIGVFILGVIDRIFQSSGKTGLAVFVFLQNLRKDPHDINERSVPGSGEQRKLYFIAIVDNLLGKCRT